MNCYVNLNNLLIFRNLLTDPVIVALRKPKEVSNPDLYGELITKAENHGLMGIIPIEYIMHAISHQANVFSCIAEKNNGAIGDGLIKAIAGDILILREFLADVFQRFKNHELLGNYIPSTIRPIAGRKILEKCFFNYGDDERAIIATKDLCEYYAKFGYGIMADFVAFNWDGEKEKLTGINNYSEMTFDKIYG